MRLKVFTVRDVFQYASKHSGSGYEERSAVIRLSPQDIQALGIKEGAAVRVKNPVGEVVVRVKQDPSCPPGYGHMPLGPYANRLITYDPEASPLPPFKGFEVTVTPCSEPVTKLESLLERR